MKTEFSMYSGFSSLVKKQGIENAAKFASSLGFSSVEFFDMARSDKTPTFQSVEEAKTAKEILNKYNLLVSCYSVGVNLVTIEGNVQKNTEAIGSLKKFADIAAALGSPYLHHTLIINLSLPQGAPSYDEVITPVVDAACEVAGYCLNLGITCLYEDQGMYFNGVWGFGKFFALMKSKCKNVGVCGDVGNTLFVDESPVPFFEAFIGDIKHVHLKDYIVTVDEKSKLCSRLGVYLKSTKIGGGNIDIESCIRLLNENGYNGALALEDDFTEDYKNSTFKTLEFIKNII